jgi:transposase InsO family protein
MHLVGCLPYFWATLKKECLGDDIFISRDEAKTAVFEYIEVYYNRKRKHSSLGYLSPAHYEKQMREIKDDFS